MGTMVYVVGYTANLDLDCAGSIPDALFVLQLLQHRFPAADYDFAPCYEKHMGIHACHVKLTSVTDHDSY